MYGFAFRFASIGSIREWQSRVPIVGYNDLDPWIRRAANGEQRVLTAEPILTFERTSGSAGANKLIPFTASLRDEFASATGPWMYDLYDSFPQLRGTTSYWSISAAVKQAEVTAGGTRIGFDDDSEYFGRFERIALRFMLAVPPAVARSADIDTWTAATARHLVAASDLGLISVWHPSFFVLLFRRIERNLDALLRTLPQHRADAIRAGAEAGRLAEALWPRLAVMSCWAEGAAATAVPELARLVPHARIQPKGLLATEGVISFPYAGSNVAAIAGHFLEFIDLEHPQSAPRLAHELRTGATYSPVITTAGGLYRYRLGDAVRCEGRLSTAPLLSFQGRIDHVSDLCGEKLSPRVVADAIAAGESETATPLRFALLAPAAGEPPHYRLYGEGAGADALEAIGAAVERKLCEVHGYRYARQLGQLAAVQTVAVRDGAARYLAARNAAGQRLGDIKPAHLDNAFDWRGIFG